MKTETFLPILLTLILMQSSGLRPVAGENPIDGESDLNAHKHHQAAGHEYAVESDLVLPEKIGDWTRNDSPRVIDKDSIFDYMDGAGELYVGYRFGHIDVYEYSCPGQDDILVELYWMASSDDAFGLLSTDWEGEPFPLPHSIGFPSWPQIPPFREIYGAGLLRLWSDNLFARIMSYNETAESRKAVLEIGRIVTTDRSIIHQPKFLTVLPSRIRGEWRIIPKRVCYFRSNLVLNSIYFLSSKNILNLDLTTEAVHALYRSTGDDESKRARVLIVKYASEENAENALKSFREAYIPEAKPEAGEGCAAYPLENGWTGFLLHGRYAAFTFDRPDRESAMTILGQIEKQIENQLKILEGQSQ